MKYVVWISLIILYSCSQASLRKIDGKNEVSLGVALNQARSSYLRGCVDAYHDLKIPKVFTHCVEKAKAHEKELMEIMDHSP
jgi:hypothetical protein